MPKRILVIEDNNDIRESVSRVLGAIGYTVIMARDGLEGLQIAQTEHPDLVLTDLMLPRLSGYEICSMLKHDARYRQIPVLIWSATKMENEDAELAKECGADGYLLKTLTINEIVQAIEAALLKHP